MTRIPAVVGLLAVCSCADPPNLGRISAQPNCAGLDRACLEEGFEAPLAVGTEVELELEVWTAPSTTPPLTMLAATAAIHVEGHRISATAEGVTALLVLDPSGDVLDVVHVWTQEGDAISLRTTDRDNPGELGETLFLAVGDTVDFTAVLEREGYDLIGTPVVELRVEGSSASAALGPVDGTLRIRAEEAGVSSLLVASGGLAKTLTVEVGA